MTADSDMVVGDSYNRELEELFELYKEVSGGKLEERGSDLRKDVACLLHESSLPYSKLVKEIHETFKERPGVTLSSVQITVLSVGERVTYGIKNPNADVLEDVSEKCLWCWEAREMKLLPKQEYRTLHNRQTIRKKIRVRIAALIESIASCKIDHVQKGSSVNLMKTLNANEIRSMFETLKHANDAEIVAKETKLKEREKKRKQCQIEKDQGQHELKRLKKEVEKEESPREIAVDHNKLKQQQKQTERNQRRQAKEESEAKNRSSLRKQARIMELFCKWNPSNQDKQERGSTTDPSMESRNTENVVNTTTTKMDCFFSEQETMAIEDLQKSHFVGWHKLCHRNSSCRWGVRRSPKIQLIKELKLQQSSSEAELFANGTNSSMEPVASKRKLIQFDKSPRPAYYGTWGKKSAVVGRLHPFKKDPTLDYDVDSEEEWEEEDPGESLSDCDVDNKESSDEENLEDEDKNEDGFVVPDGFLSEDEVFEVAGSSGGIEHAAGSSSPCSPQLNEELKESLRFQKYLREVTEQALRRDQPIVISNLMHEKDQLAMDKDLNGTPKLEMMCLQALAMQAFPTGAVIDISTNHCSSYEDQHIRHSVSRNSDTLTAKATSIPDSQLPEYVQCIQSNSSGVEKIVESLKNKFPSIPKSQLKRSVREISDFVDNRWQVKKEIINRIGQSNSPDKRGRAKGLATYFSKSSLPPESELANNVAASSSKCSLPLVRQPASSLPGYSLQPCSKTEAHPGDDAHVAESDL